MPLPIVVDAEEMRPPENVRSEVVAFDGNGSCCVDVASVPHESTPAADAFTSQDALLRLETMSCEVEARPVTERFVVVAFVVEASFAKREENVFCAVQVFAA